jgi:ribosomal protein S12 methylthiotransferase accessory factor
LLQGRSFEGLNDVPPPTFNSLAVTEPNNAVEHFIDSTGLISWKFFSNQPDYDFCAWDFSGTTQEESCYLMGILKDLNKEVYVARYEELGATACRILVPGYSEIYPVDDLIWDNTNKAMDFRADILNLHTLNDEELTDLVERLEESGMDNYTVISSLIGIEFDENTVWGQLDIGELKILIYLALKQYEQAQELIFNFLNFNDNTAERKQFYQALNVVLDITLNDELDLSHYAANLSRMYGAETMQHVIGSVTGDCRFYGLTKTSMKLEGLDKHQRLIESYHKLHKARASLRSK